MKSLIEESYWCQLNQLPKQEWAEYFDGPTGTWAVSYTHLTLPTNA